MPRAKKTKPEASEQRNDAMSVAKEKDEKEHIATAKTLLGPRFRHATAVSGIHQKQFGEADFMPGLGDYADALGDLGDKAAKGDLALASRILAAQALTLDSIFAETARRMASNMGEHLPAMEIYARIAMKAQANSRATLEALAKLHAPREQTVRHVHVNEGGQAVIADQFHHHAGQPTGGQDFGKSDKQPHATGSSYGTAGNTAGKSTPLPSPDTFGSGVPVPGGEGRKKVPNARRQG